MKRSTFVVWLTLTGACLTPAAGYSAHATSNLCVGGNSGCFATIQAAVDAAHDGDTITVAPGRFAGGITINVSVNLIGAGSAKTIIEGGGPVLTIGEEFAASEPTVSISGVTITGGSNSAVPDHAVTQGGGVRIPQAGSFPFTAGATVTIRDSVVTRNRVSAQALLPAGFCGSIDCSFASGGGIGNDGALTLINTVVSDNQAGAQGSITVFADAGGISSSQRGTLTLRHSSVTGNVATATAPSGVGVNAGGIDAGGELTIEDSLVSGNRAELSSSAPSEAGPSAFAGGISVGGSATITRTTVRDNSVTASNIGGDVLAVSGGIQDDGSLMLIDSTLDRNHVSASVPPASGSIVIAAQGGLGVSGVATVRTSVIAGNDVSADSATGFVQAGGGGIGSFGQLTLEKSLVIGNSATANGASGTLQGGGINNFSLFGAPPQLTITESVVTANRLSASPGILVQGGGLFTSSPVTLTKTVIAGNKPDQCFGC